jgi:hypothetical protein
MIEKLNIPLVKCNDSDALTDEQKKEREQKEVYLRSLGVYVRLYTNGLIYPEHPDGVHNYYKDSAEATNLVMNNKIIPEDLKERLLYYKPIMEEQLEQLKGDKENGN